MKKIILFLFLPFSALSQADQRAVIDSFMQAQVKVNNFNGNVLVAKAGKVIYQKAFGYRNYGTKELLDSTSVFELASLSKQFTAIGILLLKENGKLKLTDRLQKFFPQLPYKEITIQNLLNHTSGLPDYLSTMESKWDHHKIAFNDDMINFLASEKLPLNFVPGKKFEYSNTGYAILASIIEKVSGLSFADYMHKHIFAPLRMDHSKIYNTRRSLKDTIANYAFGYVYADSLKKFVLPDSSKENDVVFYLDGIEGDGTVNSTTGDLLKWDRALKGHTLLSENSQQAMLSPQSLMDTANHIGYGYGVGVGKDQFGEFISHSGSWPGYRTILTRYPAEDFTIIVLSNNESKVAGVSTGLAGILFNYKVLLPYVHREAAIDTSLLNQYIGNYYRYYRDSVLYLGIIRKGDKLYRNTAGTADIELKPESDKKFFYGDGSDRQIEFETDKRGKVTRGWFITSGIKSELHNLIKTNDKRNQ